MIIWTCRNCGNVSNSKQVCLNCGYDAVWISKAEPMSWREHDGQMYLGTAQQDIRAGQAVEIDPATGLIRRARFEGERDEECKLERLEEEDS